MTTPGLPVSSGHVATPGSTFSLTTRPNEANPGLLDSAGHVATPGSTFSLTTGPDGSHVADGAGSGDVAAGTPSEEPGVARSGPGGFASYPLAVPSPILVRPAVRSSVTGSCSAPASYDSRPSDSTRRNAGATRVPGHVPRQLPGHVPRQLPGRVPRQLPGHVPRPERLRRAGSGTTRDPWACELHRAHLDPTAGRHRLVGSPSRSGSHTERTLPGGTSSPPLTTRTSSSTAMGISTGTPEIPTPAD